MDIKRPRLFASNANNEVIAVLATPFIPPNSGDGWEAVIRWIAAFDADVAAVSVASVRAEVQLATGVSLETRQCLYPLHQLQLARSDRLAISHESLRYPAFDDRQASHDSVVNPVRALFTRRKNLKCRDVDDQKQAGKYRIEYA
ncbi:hypothetical protein D0Z70_21390 [Sphingobium terrigena]|uniref:Uncharacterized protein n=1 Tax=Sphingobium terrigena TaxID=2304063 RepID=A0A418YLZ0_9SPHN|nr:hypothetical protein D0Z70_21390 [Sphingobium terrigena]